MGWMFLTAKCCGCGTIIACNPYTVPSLDNNPICSHCMTKINKIRKEKGLPAHPVPKDAYEPVMHS